MDRKQPAIAESTHIDHEATGYELAQDKIEQAQA
jgi:hypothetical protein